MEHFGYKWVYKTRGLFQPLTLLSSRRKSLYSNSTIKWLDVISSLMSNMDELYGTIKVCYRYLGAINNIELNDSIQEFDNWCDMQ